MNNRRASFDYEVETNYRFPILESAIVIIILIAVVTALDLSLNYARVFETYPWEPEFAFANMEHFLRDTESHTIWVFAMASYRVTLILAFFVPLLVSSNLASSLEDGSFQTLLTYPIPRNRLVFYKIIIPIIITGLTASAAIGFTVLLIFPSGLSTLTTSIIFMAMLTHVVVIVSFMTLVSVILKKALSTALVGIGFWYATSFILATPDFPLIITIFLNPVIVALLQTSSYPVELAPVIPSVAFSLVFGVIMLIASYRTLQKTGVSN